MNGSPPNARDSFILSCLRPPAGLEACTVNLELLKFPLRPIWPGSKAGLSRGTATPGGARTSSLGTAAGLSPLERSRRLSRGLPLLLPPGRAEIVEAVIGPVPRAAAPKYRPHSCGCKERHKTTVDPRTVPTQLRVGLGLPFRSLSYCRWLPAGPRACPGLRTRSGTAPDTRPWGTGSSQTALNHTKKVM